MSVEWTWVPLSGTLAGWMVDRLGEYADPSRLPNSELVILPELRHSIIVEAPDQVIEHLRPFLDAHT